MLMPALVVATLTEEQTFPVTDSASGMAAISCWALSVKPLSTSAENPPIKLMPNVSAARSSVRAILKYVSLPWAPPMSETGVTDTRLLTMGIPYSFSMFSPVRTKYSAFLVILS